jgi:hypothetical protein
MTDENRNELDELIDAAAREYNRAGATPREVMWERIRARRDASRREIDVTPIEKRRRHWPIALAAAAVLVFGVLLGRAYERGGRDRTPSGEMANAPTVDSSDTAIQMADVSKDDSVSTAPSRGSVVATVPPESRSIAVPLPPPTRPFVRSVVPDSAAGGNNLTYRLAVAEHLARTEAMLTSFRVEAKRGAVDAELTKWARDLLTTTRLLEATAGAKDPMMKRLLGDLELVLLQIAQYTKAGTRSAEELEMIEHSMERRGVIGKIRTTIPARVAPAGT